MTLESKTCETKLMKNFVAIVSPYDLWPIIMCVNVIKKNAL